MAVADFVGAANRLPGRIVDRDGSRYRTDFGVVRDMERARHGGP